MVESLKQAEAMKQPLAYLHTVSKRIVSELSRVMRSTVYQPLEKKEKMKELNEDRHMIAGVIQEKGGEQEDEHIFIG